jgi:hypothetical protein
VSRYDRILCLVLGASLFLGGMAGLILEHHHKVPEASPFTGPPYNAPDIRGVKP